MKIEKMKIERNKNSINRKYFSIAASLFVLTRQLSTLVEKIQNDFRWGNRGNFKKNSSINFLKFFSVEVEIKLKIL